MLRKTLIAAGALLVAFGANARIEWLQTDYDFGTMKEVAGPRTGSVRFVNKGKEAVMINDVRPSCGCTGADYTRGEIAPGDTATVSFTYNPKGRPGRFEKTIKVFTGSDNARSVITIRGVVVGAPETLSARYPIEAGPLRLSEKTLVAADVRYGSARHLFLQGYNQSMDTIYPVWNHPSRALSLGISDRAVGPGDMVSFSLYFNSREEKGPGHYDYDVEITANSRDKNSPKATVEFIANVVPDPKAVSAETLATAPSARFSPEVIDLGEISKEKAQLKFTAANTGKGDLHIRRMAGGGIKIKSYPVRLAPGKKGECTGFVDLKSLPAGPFALMLEISTDDPVKPVSTVRVAGIKK